MVSRKKAAAEVAEGCATLARFVRLHRRDFAAPKSRAARLDEADALIDILYCQSRGDVKAAKDMLLSVCLEAHGKPVLAGWLKLSGLSRENVRDNAESAIRAQLRRRAS